MEPAVEDGEPVGKPQQTAPVWSHAARAVVAHVDLQGAVLDARRDRSVAGTRMLRDVRQRLGYDEVRRRLERERPEARDALLLSVRGSS